MMAGSYAVRSSRGRRRLDGLTLADAALEAAGLVVRSAELDRPRAILEVAAKRKLTLGFADGGWERQAVSPYCSVRLGLCSSTTGVFTIAHPEQLRARGVAGYLLVDLRSAAVFHFHASDLELLDGDLGDAAAILAYRSRGILFVRELQVSTHAEWLLGQRVHRVSAGAAA